MSTIYHIAPKRSGHAMVARLIQEWCPDTWLVDQENVRPSRFGVSGGTVVLQTRDLLNWVASYYQNHVNRVGVCESGTVLKRVKTLWMPISKEYYRVTTHIKDRVVRVYYDEFILNEAVRGLVCQQLGGKYSERSINVVKSNGRGSSFDGTEFDGEAYLMETRRRYRQVPSELYDHIFTRRPDWLEFYVRHQSPDADKMNFLRQTLDKKLIKWQMQKQVRVSASMQR